MIPLIRIVFFLIALFYLLSIPVLLSLGTIGPKDFVTFWGIIPLGIIAIYQEQFKRWLFAPKLVIEFTHQEPFSIRTELTEVATGIFVAFCYYFRFGVYNQGKSQAKLCEAIIETLWEEHPGQGWVKSTTFQPVNLIWSNDKSKIEFLNINPKARWFCDIGSISQRGSVLRFKFEVMFRPNSQPKIIRDGLFPEQKCKIKVALYSENAEKVEKCFLIKWSGVWKDNSVEMFKEIVIESC